MVLCTEQGRVFFLDTERNVVTFDLAVPLSSFALGKVRGPLLGGSTGMAVALLSGQLRLYYDIRLSRLQPPQVQPPQAAFAAHPEVARLCGEQRNERMAVDAALYAEFVDEESEFVQYRSWLKAQLDSPEGQGDAGGP
eukprot:Tamp_27917.p1 GENE.Tamp_27917~~Tamp_27917.p1  ORF type:complete len:138 (-),score=10.76 Tamp_27917:39-452(-)